MRLPVFVLIIACVVTVIELLMQAFFYDLFLVLGIFIPLIVTNCAIIGRAEGFRITQSGRCFGTRWFYDGTGLPRRTRFTGCDA